MLRVENLQVKYGESVIVRDVSLRVKENQVVALMGRNGVGKTTVIKAIIGSLKSEKGDIWYKGQKMTGWAPEKRAKSGIGLVPQGREIFAQLSVYENVLLGLEAARDRRNSIPDEALEKFPVIKAMFSRKGGDLSGGQQQQLAFARALASSPDLLLLDEPTEGIQPSIVQDIQDVIRDLKHKGGMSILLVEQSVDFVMDVADYVYVLDRGKVVAEGDISTMSRSQLEIYLVV